MAVTSAAENQQEEGKFGMVKKQISVDDIIFNTINYFLLTLILLVILYPLYFILIASVSSPLEVMSGNVIFYPQNASLDAYKLIFRDAEILSGYKNTIFYTAAGVFINVTMTIFAAYPLSRQDWAGRKFFTLMLAVTMFFSGGMIPTYIIVSKIGMRDTIWAMLIPSAVSFWYVVIMRTYFSTNIPGSLIEAAFIDGASNFKLLFRIVIPLSKPVISVMVLFYGVAHWNSFFPALIYLSDRKLFPLQLILREILIQNRFSEEMLVGEESLMARQLAAESIKYGAIVVASAPIIAVYPLIQKYFVKGIMVGAIKG